MAARRRTAAKTGPPTLVRGPIWTLRSLPNRTMEWNWNATCRFSRAVMVVAPKAGQSQTGGSTFGPIKREKAAL